MNKKSIFALILAIATIVGLYFLAIVFDDKGLTKGEVIKILSSYKNKNLLVEGEFWIDVKNEDISESAVKYTKAIVVNYLITSMQLLRDKYGVEVNYVGINESVDSDRVNIFVISEDPENLLEKLDVSQNAAYLGFGNIVIFDKRFIDSFLYVTDFGSLDHKDLSNDELKGLRSEFWMHRRMMFLWLVTHEVGHIAKHRSIKHNIDDHADANGKFSKDREIEADQFVVEVLQNDPGKDYEFTQAYRLWSGLHSYASRISNELYNKSITELILGNGPISVSVASLTHPPKLFRAVSMNSVLTDSYGFESPNRYKQIVDRMVFKEVVK